MKKGKIKFFKELPSRESKQLGTLYPHLVVLDNGDEIIVDKKSPNALQVGNYLEYRYKNQTIKYQGREYKTASDIGYQNKEYQKPTNNYTKPQPAPNKDVTISKLACLKAAAEFNAGRPQSDRVSVVEDAKHFYNWIIS